MQRYVVGWLAVLSVLPGILARPEAARACSLPRNSIHVRDTPANAALIVDVACWSSECFEGALPAEVEVVDTTTGLPVPGSVIYSAGSIESLGLVAWKPDAPLTVGRSYELMWQPKPANELAELDYVFEATPEIVGTAAVEVELVHGVDDYFETTSCRIDTSIGTCGPDTQTIGIKSKRYASLVATLADVSEAVAAQLQIRTAFWSEGKAQPALTDHPPFASRGLLTARFDTEDSAYCYLIELESMIDGSTTTHEACLPHGSLGALDVHERSEEEVTAQMGGCASPPAGDYMAQWCSARTEQCALHPNTWPSCGTAEQMCAGAIDEPEPMEPIDPGDPNEPMEPSEPMEPVGAAGMSAEMSEPERELRSACSASPSASGRSSLGLMLALLATALYTRRIGLARVSHRKA